MNLDPSKVDSQESFVEFLAALQYEYTEEKQKAQDQALNVPRTLDVTVFLDFLQFYVTALCDTKRNMPPSWETFARLLLITKRHVT